MEMTKQTRLWNLSRASFVTLLAAPMAWAQYQYPQSFSTTFDQYKDYPQLRGETQSLMKDKLPSWMSWDFELRSRTEGQTAINLLPGQAKFYELERVTGGLRLRPTSWLSVYVQFHDLHAFGPSA
jgi:hypothetical protein